MFILLFTMAFARINTLSSQYGLEFDVTDTVSTLMTQEVYLLEAINKAKAAFIQLGKRDALPAFSNKYGMQKFVTDRNNYCQYMATYYGSFDKLEFDICKIAKNHEQIIFLRKLADDFMQLVTDQNTPGVFGN